MAISVAPFLEMPAHTSTESGCFGFGVDAAASFMGLYCLGKNRSQAPWIHRYFLNVIIICSSYTSSTTSDVINFRSGENCLFVLQSRYI